MFKLCQAMAVERDKAKRVSGGSQPNQMQMEKDMKILQKELAYARSSRDTFKQVRPTKHYIFSHHLLHCKFHEI